ncbi:MAG: type II toxin-antitoxin system prevent-host-death family antitoxin [Gemmatimonadota bacterium]|nr:type II toxin-antitoxin system prevent-host-death family antitoxin [Gemmatimonadota bacterium]
MKSQPSKQLNLYEAKSHLSQLVTEAAAGAEIIIAKAGKPMARLVPLAPERKPKREPGQWAGQVWIAEDDSLPPDILAAFYGEDENPDDPLRWPIPIPAEE